MVCGPLTKRTNIMNQQVISFHYTLTDPQGKTLDSSAGREPLSFVTGLGQIIPGLESHLTGMASGEKKRVTVPAKDAYGERDDARTFDVPRERFPIQDAAVGDRFRMGDGHHAMIVTVTKMTDTHVTMDANHPLAGVDLTFDLELVAKRDATPADLESCCGSHAHGDCGHGDEDGCCGRHDRCEH
jgi:FKBP-type peptidyl-prolyl cis-trans isomerase SlyD